jgi:NAD(P)-dependent dehydrogenase (short-subunit alcohol dehydrogenase family)
MGRMDGKVVLVTGAARGIGHATAALLVSEGAHVALADINDEGCKLAAQEISEGHAGHAVALHLDVTEEADWEKGIAEVRDTFGGLHGLVNNAGSGALGTIEEAGIDDLRWLNKLNVESVFLGCKHAVRLIHASGGGSIVNMSSVAGLIADPNMAVYNTTKAAVRHLTKSVALHCAKDEMNVRCNSVHPAFIRTALLDPLVESQGPDILDKLAAKNPMGRLGEPMEVAFAVLYLLSDESSFVTGTELVIDGGLSAQ